MPSFTACVYDSKTGNIDVCLADVTQTVPRATCGAACPVKAANETLEGRHACCVLFGNPLFVTEMTLLVKVAAAGGGFIKFFTVSVLNVFCVCIACILVFAHLIWMVEVRSHRHRQQHDQHRSSCPAPLSYPSPSLPIEPPVLYSASSSGLCHSPLHTPPNHRLIQSIDSDTLLPLPPTHPQPQLTHPTTHKNPSAMTTGPSSPPSTTGASNTLSGGRP